MDSAQIRQLLEKNLEHNPTQDQRILLQKLSDFLFEYDEQTVFLMKGYAGTGKTTIIASLVKSLPQLRLKTVLLAPTGRAAKVMANYSGSLASTIHRRIYKIYTQKDGYLRIILQPNMFKNTLFIVDEASMIPDYQSDAEPSLFTSRNLLQDLMEYVDSGYRCKLLISGDTAQLPPVGIDISPALNPEYLTSVFNAHIQMHELKEVVRQASDSGILYNATFLRKIMIAEAPDFPLFDTNGFPDIVNLPGTELEEELIKAFNSHDKEGVVIICRSNKRANMFNQEIRKRILFQDNEIAAGDYLMIVRNNYYWLPKDSEAGFFANGDLVEITRIRKYEELYDCRFADVSLRLVDYPNEKEIEVKILLDTLSVETPSFPWEKFKTLYQEVMKDYEDLPKKERLDKTRNNPYYQALQVKFAYSLTCHKTQGGQWNTVFIDLGYFTQEMLDREYLRWLYTALTRARVNVYLIAFPEFFFQP